MTHIVETAAGFVEDALAGLVDVHGDLLRRIDGGVARRAPTSGKVVVVSGGGSGALPRLRRLRRSRPVRRARGLREEVVDVVDGLFLGRSAHDPAGLAAVVAEARSLRAPTKPS